MNENIKISKSGKLLMQIRNGETLSTSEKIYLTAVLSFPAILAQIVSIVMQYIDAAMVGHLGENASASIGLISTSTWLVGGTSMAAVSGFSIQVAQAIGAKKYKYARKLMWQSYFIVLGLALILMLGGLIIVPVLPKMLGGSADIVDDAGKYFMIFSLGLPIVAMSRLAGAMLQASGNMKVPGLLNSLVCILDIIFNFFFIFPTDSYKVFGMNITLPGVGLGVMGAAIGTVTAELVVCILMYYFLWGKRSILSKKYIGHEIEEDRGEIYDEEFGNSKKISGKEFNKADLRRAWMLAWPIGLEHIAICGAMVVTTVIVAPLGKVAIAANSFAITAESLCYMPGYGIGDASATLVGQSIGAGRRGTAYSFGKITIAAGMVIMTLTGIIMYIAAPYMIGFLTSVKEIRDLGTSVLRIEAFAEPFYAASIVAAGALRGAGDTLKPFIMNLVSIWGVRLVLAFTLTGRVGKLFGITSGEGIIGKIFRKNYGLKGIWIAMCLELCFRGTIFLIRFIRKKWIPNIKKEDL
ncbi:Na+-driven multidrug efflux pump [Eubacterium ruminantium]|uniref:Probable multidrug resistance protein NorM n=1 Tax=Eubacterium ruminantium TaxID=42322 RepID=A0A1T4L162_9FIRM|nr:MATE family efflux transporter [Eubacterium ruminantium]SCW42601.1 Na+-driven multidrug efflux pump [Eubacterium ruminantium]SDN21213.1 Na+-driven multidrug efflux pump [Eubacterium ruminantium]SJZ48472.1 Na+-driven multidrug efflux pump [Eubacterium ruminantium]